MALSSAGLIFAVLNICVRYITYMVDWKEKV
jgi:hypothetical protein